MRGDRGPIPAPAGQPISTGETAVSARAYPRTCGAARQTISGPLAPQGLSPHLRGSHVPATCKNCLQGPIPAPAGQPAWQPVGRPPPRAYPRTCGAAPGSGRTGNRPSGLSPHLRGSLQRTALRPCALGPIPAPAGQPGKLWLAFAIFAAYPRTCGAADGNLKGFAQDWGLSPHLRGSRHQVPPACRCVGPIPAPAGQPSRSIRASRPVRAYPRTCGAAATWAANGVGKMGLSPHLRGSRGVRQWLAVRLGPIPAPAGQPLWGSSSVPSRWAYPRTCGAAEKRLHIVQTVMGLSPHLRGSRTSSAPGAARSGPIPAPAGQPRSDQPRDRSPWAYPRTCGAAQSRDRPLQQHRGLSPHLRGSPHVVRLAVHGPGPIPAPAGQPSAASRDAEDRRAYPRTCGAATRPIMVRHSNRGLSPHLRGSQVVPSLPPRFCGPIPAPAGQPRRPWGRYLRSGAYPRTCGAATG